MFNSSVSYMLISVLVCLLFSNAVAIRRDKSILYSRTVIIGLLFSSFLVYSSLYVKSLAKGIGIYGSLFNVTTFTSGFNFFIFSVSAVILTLTAFYPRRVKPKGMREFSTWNSLLYNDLFYYNEEIISYKTGEQYRIIEYPLIIVFILTGAAFLMSTGDLVSIFLSIELQSYGLYILSTLYRDSESATASGLTYFLLGGLSSCFILLGSALLYANSGTTNLDNIYIISSLGQSTYLFNTYDTHYIQLSLIIMSVGFLFKVSSAPFHFWSPDVYDGVPTIVTTYIAIVPKISIFAFFLELVYYTKGYFSEFSWTDVLLLSSLLSLIIGSVLGLTQFRIKRLFAYSTISHVGFILLALSINNVESIQAYIFYILQYTISNLNAFIILLTMGYTLFLYVSKEKENLKDKNNSPIQLINQIKGYFYINHYIAISLAITLFSFVGVPPLIGFFAKQMILSAALDSGHVFMGLVAILTSVIGAAYYLNLIKQIFFFKHAYNVTPYLANLNLIGYLFGSSSKKSANTVDTSLEQNIIKDKVLNNKISFTPQDIVISSSLSSSISLLTLLIALFINMPNEWFNVVSIIALILFKS